MNKQNNFEYSIEFRNIYHQQVKPLLLEIEEIKKKATTALLLPVLMFSFMFIFILAITYNKNIILWIIPNIMVVIFLIFVISALIYALNNAPEIKQKKIEILKILVPFVLDDAVVLTEDLYSRSETKDTPKINNKYLLEANANAQLFNFFKLFIHPKIAIVIPIFFTFICISVVWTTRSILAFIFSLMFLCSFCLVFYAFYYVLKANHNIVMFKFDKDFRNHIIALDDHFQGTHNGIDVDIQELEFATGQKLLLISFPQNKKTNSTITIRNRAFTFTRLYGSPVKLEDAEFNRIYETTSDNQTEARYMLSPSLMERLKILHKKGIIVSFCMQNKYNYIAIKTTRNLFEFSQTKCALAQEVFMRPIFELTEVLSIIDILKLDENIGL